MLLFDRLAVIGVGFAVVACLTGCKHKLPNIGGASQDAASDAVVPQDASSEAGASQDAASDAVAPQDHPATDGVASTDVPTTGDVADADATDMTPVPVCPAGQHMCPGGCVANNDVNTCGMSCTPCQAPTGGTVTCNGTTCLATCPAGMKLCAGTCIASSAACSGVCPAGTHDCGGICQPDTSTSFCGAACMQCATPPSNGTAVCSAGTCGISCGSGYRNCPGTNLCVPMTGGCCVNSDCTAGGPNTTGVCGAAKTCSYPCAPTAKTCGSACIPMASCCVASDCSGVCQTCPAPGGTCGPKASGAADSACLPANCKSGTCNGAGACNPAANGASCGPAASCSGTTKTTATLCNATGMCIAATMQSCPNGCNGTNTDCLNCGPGMVGCSGACCSIFRGLGVSTYVSAVSGDGTFLVGRSGSSNVRWTRAGVATPLPNLAGETDCSVDDTSGNSSVSVGTCADFTKPVRWSGTSAPTQLVLPPSPNVQDPPFTAGLATAVSSNGLVITGYVGSYTAIWATGAAPRAIPKPAGTNISYGVGINSDGSVIVGQADTTTGRRAFRWNLSTEMVTFLTPLAGGSGDAFAVSSDGSKIVGGSGPPNQAVLWNGVTPTALAPAESGAFSISGDGSTVVGHSPSGAFYWNGTFQVLASILSGMGVDLTGWTLTSAKDVSANGKVIVGNGMHNGAYEAWIVVLP